MHVYLKKDFISELYQQIGHHLYFYNSVALTIHSLLPIDL